MEAQLVPNGIREKVEVAIFRDCGLRRGRSCWWRSHRQDVKMPVASTSLLVVVAQSRNPNASDRNVVNDAPTAVLLLQSNVPALMAGGPAQFRVSRMGSNQPVSRPSHGFSPC